MLSGFFIGRPRFAFVLSIVIALAGLVAIRAIPVAEFPEIAPPQVQVTTSYPGADAQVVQEAVAAPIEAEVNGVDGMLSMSSTSANGGGYTLTVTFAVGTDPDIAAVNVQNRVAIAQARLPQEVVRQGIVTRKQSSNMLMVVNLTSPEGTHDGLFLSNYASIHVQDALSRINGVGNVAQFGALDYGMRVWLDPNRLALLKLTATDVAAAIRAQNVQATAGQIGAPPFDGAPQFQYAVRARGRLATVEEFGNVIVRADAAGSFVRLQGRGPDRAGLAGLQRDLEARQPAGGHDRGLPVARGQRAHGGRRGPCEARGARRTLPAGRGIQGPLRHHPGRARLRAGGGPDPVHHLRAGGRGHLPVPRRLALDPYPDRLRSRSR